ncbi:MAG TPA: DUF1203 domain-containing protein [Caldimonas sp.]
MASLFQLSGLSPEPFAALFALADATLAARGIRRVRAEKKPGYPCRVSLEDADVGETLLLLPWEHQPSSSPYRASGPIFVRPGVARARPAAGAIPESIASRLLSVRVYDADDMMVAAEVCEGKEVAALIERCFADARTRYIHLHNARRGCFACRVDRT